MTELEREGIIGFVADQPDLGAPMVGTGGCRKFRSRRKGGGKSGGYRVISFYAGTEFPVFLLTVFGKGEKDSLTKAERNALKILADRLIETYRQTVVRVDQ